MQSALTAHSNRLSASQADDAVRIKLRVSHLLNTVAFETPWLSPSSTLILRKFPDPLPKGLARDSDSRIASAEWELAVQAALRNECARAVRPAHGISTSSNAVFFESPAELLACLMRDLSNGDAIARWWWRSYLRGTGVTLGNALVGNLLRAPSHVPAAIAKLVEWGEAERVMQCLSPSQAQTVLQEVLRVYALPGLLSVIRAEAIFAAREQQLAQPGSPETARMVFQDANLFPWEPTVSGRLTPNYLGSERQALLGICLTLTRSPHRARAPRFAQLLQRWVTLKKQASTNSDPRPQAQGNPPENTAQPLQPLSGPYQTSVVPTQGSSTNSASLLHPPPAASTRIHAMILPRDVDGKASQSEIAAPESTRTDANDSPHAEMDSQGMVATQLVGLFFLIPFFRSLKVFEYFETEFQDRQIPGPWGLLELFGRALLANSIAPLLTDPVWKLLSVLDGRREGEACANEFLGFHEYKLPAPWIERFDVAQNGTLTLRRSAKRWIVFHPQGFPVIDVELDGLPPERNAEQYFAPTGSASTFLPKLHFGGRKGLVRKKAARLAFNLSQALGGNPEVIRFAQFFTPFFRWAFRKILATNLLPENTIVKSALVRPGRLYATSTHIDLVMDLDSATTNVRIAGLDANPGWAPEFGRVISFHYR